MKRKVKGYEGFSQFNGVLKKVDIRQMQAKKTAARMQNQRTMKKQTGWPKSRQLQDLTGREHLVLLVLWLVGASVPTQPE